MRLIPTLLALLLLASLCAILALGEPAAEAAGAAPGPGSTARSGQGAARPAATAPSSETASRKPDASRYGRRITTRAELDRDGGELFLSTRLLVPEGCASWPVEVLLIREGLDADQRKEYRYGVRTAPAGAEVGFQVARSGPEPASGWSLWVGGYPAVELLELDPDRHTQLTLDLRELAWIRVEAGSAARPQPVDRWRFWLDGSPLPPHRRAAKQGDFRSHSEFLPSKLLLGRRPEGELSCRVLVRDPAGAAGVIGHSYSAAQRKGLWARSGRLRPERGPQLLRLDVPTGVVRYRFARADGEQPRHVQSVISLVPARWKEPPYRRDDRLLLRTFVAKGRAGQTRVRTTQDVEGEFDSVADGEYRLAWRSHRGVSMSPAFWIEGGEVELELALPQPGCEVEVRAVGLFLPERGAPLVGVMNLETGWFPPAQRLGKGAAATFEHLPPGRYQAYWGGPEPGAAIAGFGEPFVVNGAAGLEVQLDGSRPAAYACPLVAP